jgi:hypothetical protein
MVRSVCGVCCAVAVMFGDVSGTEGESNIFSSHAYYRATKLVYFFELSRADVEELVDALAFFPDAVPNNALSKREAFSIACIYSRFFIRHWERVADVCSVGVVDALSSSYTDPISASRDSMSEKLNKAFTILPAVIDLSWPSWEKKPKNLPEDFSITGDSKRPWAGISLKRVCSILFTISSSSCSEM